MTRDAYRLFLAFGALLVFVAALFRTGALPICGPKLCAIRASIPKLLADGPYRYVRNPLYLGNIFMAVGIGLMASRTGFFILSLGMTLFVFRLILREQSELLRIRANNIDTTALLFRGSCFR